MLLSKQWFIPGWDKGSGMMGRRRKEFNKKSLKPGAGGSHLKS
jgi:hypothetical protein